MSEYTLKREIRYYKSQLEQCRKEIATLKISKGITITEKELELIGVELSMTVNNKLKRRNNPENFKVLKALQSRLKK